MSAEPEILEVAAGEVRIGDRIDEGREVIQVVPCCGSVEVVIGQRAPRIERLGGDESIWENVERRHYRYAERVRVVRMVEPPHEVEV